MVGDNSRYSWRYQFEPPPMSQLIIYELHIGAFGGSSKDPKNAGGTFLTCVDRLDHLADLGINCIELMPLNQDTHPHW